MSIKRLLSVLMIAVFLSVFMVSDSAYALKNLSKADRPDAPEAKKARDEVERRLPEEPDDEGPKGAMGAAAAGELSSPEAKQGMITALLREEGAVFSLDVGEDTFYEINPVLLGAFLESGKLELDVIDTSALTGTKSYSLALAEDAIDIIVFRGDYVSNDIDTFVAIVQGLPPGKIAVILASNGDQEEMLANDPRIAEQRGNRIFITRLEGEIATQWSDLLAGLASYDLSELSPDDLIGNRALIQGLLTAK